MALLTSPQTNACLAEFIVALRKAVLAVDGLTKQDIKDAINGIDAYYEANQAAMNTAIPQPARGALTTGMKAVLYAIVALKRYGGEL